MIFHFRGTALGGWLVLEPWLTPSLFYQFLGASKRFGDEAPKHVGLDTYTFCTSLGDEEANRQLRRHWKTWVTEDQISNLQKIGVDTLRIPVGDWMYVPYEPYIGCMDGSLEELDRVLDLCRIYNINVIIDIHAIVGSQVNK
jgi:glucan 1,3-beta-glucosidase